MISVRRFVRRKLLKRRMVREINKRFDPRDIIKRKRREIERVMDIQIEDKRIQKLKVLKRIPGLELLLSLKKSKTFGRAFGRLNGIYIGVGRFVEAEIRERKLDKHHPKSREIAYEIDRIVEVLTEIAVHEFVHLVDPSAWVNQYFSIMDAGRIANVLEGNFDQRDLDSAVSYLSTIPLSELVAIGTTAIVLEQEIQAGREIPEEHIEGFLYLKKTKAEPDNLILLQLRFNHVMAYFRLNKHFIARRFIEGTLQKYGDGLIREIISRRPNYSQLIQPEIY